MQKNEMVHGKQKFVICCMSRLCIFFLINISFCCEIVFSQNALFTAMFMQSVYWLPLFNQISRLCH